MHSIAPISSFPETADIETASEDYARRFSGAVGGYFLEKQADITLELMADHPGATVLDVGGGHAQLALPLVKKGFELTVTGSHPLCRKRLDALLPSGSFRYHGCDMLALPFENRAFDWVLAFRLLPHVSQWQRLIRELCRVASKAVIVDYPDIRSFNILYRLLFDLKKAMEGNTRPFLMFSRSQLAKNFAANDFGNPVFRPEFFAPMVLHRKLKNVSMSKALESVFQEMGLTRRLGSPIILKVSRTDE